MSSRGLVSILALCYAQKMTPSDFIATLSPAFEVLERPEHFDLVCRTSRRRWMTTSVDRSGRSAELLIRHARDERVGQLA
jgi:hypothetical protein